MGFLPRAPRHNLSGNPGWWTIQSTENQAPGGCGREQGSTPHCVINSACPPHLQPICGQISPSSDHLVSKLSWPFLPLLRPFSPSSWASSHLSERKRKEENVISGHCLLPVREQDRSPNQANNWPMRWVLQQTLSISKCSQNPKPRQCYSLPQIWFSLSIPYLSESRWLYSL